MRRSLALATVTAAALAAAQAAGAADAGPTLTPLRSITFPDRAYVLTLPRPAAVTAGRVSVYENGRPVSGVSVIPAGQRTRTFATILALDASNSMRGGPIDGALAAARLFAARRPAGQPLGVILFNDRVQQLLAPTARGGAIRFALRRAPALREGTRLYDAALAAVEALRAAKITAGTVILLTDGRDVGSRASARQVAAAARRAGVRVFAVGLRSRQFSPHPLAALARASGGAYAEAGSAADLAAVYGALSERLAREYLIRYRSLAGPDLAVRVEVRVAGVEGTASSRYRTPALPASSAGPYHRSLVDRFLLSTLSVVLMSLAAAAAAAFVVSLLLRRRQSPVRHRIAAFLSTTPPPRSQEPSGGKGSRRRRWAARWEARLERALERAPWWDRLKEEIEIADFPIPALPLVVGTAALTAFFAVLFALTLPPVFVPFALGVPFIALGAVRRKLSQKRERFAEQLPDNLTVLAASLRAGHSFVGALSAVVEEAEEPSRSELQRAVADEQLGMPIEQALVRVAERMANGDLEQVALVAALQRDTGGNTAEVLDTVVETVRQRFELRRLVQALTAQGRIARWILTVLPVVVVLLVLLINPGYLSPLFHTGSGQLLLALSIALMIAGSIAIKRIVDIDL